MKFKRYFCFFGVFLSNSLCFAQGTRSIYVVSRPAVQAYLRRRHYDAHFTGYSDNSTNITTIIAVENTTAQISTTTEEHYVDLWPDYSFKSKRQIYIRRLSFEF